MGAEHASTSKGASRAVKQARQWVRQWAEARSWDLANSPVSGAKQVIAPTLRTKELEEPGALQMRHRGDATQKVVTFLPHASQPQLDGGKKMRTSTLANRLAVRPVLAGSIH